MAADGSRAWILSGSPEHYAATAAHGLSIVRCLTRVMRAAAAIGITGAMFDDLHAAAGVPA